MEQKSFNRASEDVPLIINPSESHMALVLVLDVSGSMQGEPIAQLNAGINRFKADVCKDKLTRRILDVAIICFYDRFEVLQDFVPIEHMEHVNLEAGGLTNFTEPIREAMRMADERGKFYRRHGTEPFKPWIIFVTDGEPHDDITQIAKQVQKAQEKNKIRFIALGVGDYKLAPLRQLTDVVIRMEGYDFTSFFDWVNKSMRAVSVSSPGERPSIPPLEGNVHRDMSDV